MSARTDPQALRSVALRLFLEHGYDEVPVARVAREAGVSHMTFFRHFPAKESVVVEDLFDPVLAAAVEAQPPTDAPLRRVVHGLLAALESPEGAQELESDEFRARITLLASTPSLRGAVWGATAATEEALVHALVTSGASVQAARAAVGAALGAATAILLDWASGDGKTSPAIVLADGLRSLIGATP